MIDSEQLLNDLKKLVLKLEKDIHQRTQEHDETLAQLQAQHAAARQAERTAQMFNAWRDEMITQAAVAWVLSCVFVRFIEDNELIAQPWISGAGDRLRDAQEQKRQFFRDPSRATLSDREYLKHIFERMAEHKCLASLFDTKHNMLWQLEPTADGAAALVQFFQARDTATGELVHDFTDPGWDTRFLGDLYQDLSENIRKKYALLQTPDFVEEFILDRTLDPAMETFGLAGLRMIDPTCGSGHFLIGGFRRILERWMDEEPAAAVMELTNRALGSVYGVDLNPYAVAIAQFRLFLCAMQACELRTLAAAPAFKLNVVTGDSLLHGPPPNQQALGAELFLNPIKHVSAVEDADAIWTVLSQSYHAVVGNPPYITVKDAKLRAAYKAIFSSCSGKYALVCPFMERFFALAAGQQSGAAGYVGLIVANSFMKREFGKKLVEELIPQWDVTHVIDTSGAYIPGHGTPTVILYGRNRRPNAEHIRTCMGIRGEPGAPDDAAFGKVWRSIVDLLDTAGEENDFVSIDDTDRDRLHTHPWSLQGGGAIELKEVIEESSQPLCSIVDVIGVFGMTNADEVMLCSPLAFRRQCVPRQSFRPIYLGDLVRDWRYSPGDNVLFPYDDETLELKPADTYSGVHRWIWFSRTTMAARATFGGGTYRADGRPWWEWHQVALERLHPPLSIAFAFVATHNHYVLDRGGKVFKQSAPVIKLPADATEEQHLELLGLLNSSVACFWMKQMFYPKGGDQVGGDGARVSKNPWEDRYEHDGTKLKQFPVVGPKPSALARKLDVLSQQISELLPDRLVRCATPTRDILLDAESRYRDIRGRMIALQEELDWQCYHLYGITEAELRTPQDDLPGLMLGERAFEIVLARKVAAGAAESSWFTRHGSTPITEIPAHWPAAYRDLVQRRIDVIESDRNIRLLEQPEHKRRWASDSWDDMVEVALQEWLANRLEYLLSGRDLLAEAEAGENREPTESPTLLSIARLADMARADTDFLAVAELYSKRPDFDVTKLVEKLVVADAVPELPLFRYKAAGLRKRLDWEQVWALQRQEDAHHARIMDCIYDPETATIRLSRSDWESYQAFVAKLKPKRGITRLSPDQDGGDFVFRERHLEGYNAKTVNGLADKIAWHLAGAAVGDIPVPPKYTGGDFAKTAYYKLRGKLDVSKERFVLYPEAERSSDTSAVITWAGWDHLQRAMAMAAYYEDIKMKEDWGERRRALLLATMLELVPWIKQWHLGIDPEYGEEMGEYLETYLDGEAREVGYSLAELKEIK